MNNPITLLEKMITISSFSREEKEVSDMLYNHLTGKGIEVNRYKNNLWAVNRDYNPDKTTVMLCSHMDTVKPSPNYTRDPFKPTHEDGKLYGLGSNDAGASVVSLIKVFCTLYGKKLNYNLLLAISAEEEIGGVNGMTSLWHELPKVDFCIIGEPTKMECAVAERGLMVLDCVAEGRPGHAAREEGENAIYNALKDIEWFRRYQFPKVSELMGTVKMTVTQINAGTQHNMVPGQCEFVVDVRPTDMYSNAELAELISQQVTCKATPRSLRLNASAISKEHPLVQAVERLGIERFISPTTSDISVIPAPCIKIGPGDSARSHTADEYVYVSEIEKGIEVYLEILKELNNHGK